MVEYFQPITYILQLVRQNNWDHFTLGIFKMKKVQSPPDGCDNCQNEGESLDEFSE